jgi:hypothetical protein
MLARLRTSKRNIRKRHSHSANADVSTVRGVIEHRHPHRQLCGPSIDKQRQRSWLAEGGESAGCAN